MDTVREGGILSSQLPTDDPNTAGNVEEPWRFSVETAAYEEDASEKDWLQAQEATAAMRQELKSFVKNLRNLELDGDPLIDFPSDHEHVVAQLLAENRQGYESLKDWIGPRRYQDLPVADLNAEQEEMQQGLERIDQLDEILKAKTIEEYIVQRETFPVRTRSKEERQRRKRQKHLENTLKRERQRIQRIERLKRAMNCEIEDSKEDSDAWSQSYQSRLKPMEVCQLEELMKQEDQDLMENPFDCDVFVTAGTERFLLENQSLRNSYLFQITEFQSLPLGETDWQSEYIRESVCLPESISCTDCGSFSKKSSLYQSLKPDYLQQMRQEKEQSLRLSQIDSALQKIRTSDIQDISITTEQMEELIEDARSDLHNNEIDIMDFTNINTLSVFRGDPI